jgi:hypothetical protein
MARWEYALLVRRRAPGGAVTITWYAPDGSGEDRTQFGTKALVHLNRAGAVGWELVEVTAYYHPERSELRVDRYHLKRVVPPQSTVDLQRHQQQRQQRPQPASGATAPGRG